MTEGNDDHTGVDWAKLEQEIHESHENPMQALQAQIITPDMLAKRMLWDITPCSQAEDVGSLLGYEPASEDVEDMEHKAAHLRLENAGLVAPYVAEMSQHAAAAVVGSMIVGHGDEVPADDRNDTIDKLRPVISQAAYAIIAELIDVGVLHTPHFAAFMFQEEDGDDE